MLSHRLAFAALAVACIGAAAGGSYMASRQNVAPAAAIASSPAAPETTALPPVQETEALVGDTPLKAGVDPTPTVPTEAVERQDPASGAARTAARTSTESARRAPVPVKTATVKPPQVKSPQVKSSTANSPTANPAQRATKEPEPLPTLERTWPSGAATTVPTPTTAAAPTAASAPAADAVTPTARPDERIAQQEAPHTPEPPQKTFEELVVSADSVIGLIADTPVSSERAKVEDRVEARVTRDVRVGDTVVIPSGSRALGTVVQVERGGKFKQTARLGIRFNTLVLADGTRLPITTQPFYRDGAPPGNESAAKVSGLSVGGAILGAILGGSKGAAIGAATGAAAGASAVMASDRNAATIAPGEAFTVKITAPVTVTIEQK
ncbi:MAG: hypothetical protein ABI868_16860 [Acidobacteriota bacterium]